MVRDAFLTNYHMANFSLKKMEEKSSGKAAPFGLAGYSFFWA